MKNFQSHALVAVIDENSPVIQSRNLNRNITTELSSALDRMELMSRVLVKRLSVASVRRNALLKQMRGLIHDQA